MRTGDQPGTHRLFRNSRCQFAIVADNYGVTAALQPRRQVGAVGIVAVNRPPGRSKLSKPQGLLTAPTGGKRQRTQTKRPQRPRWGSPVWQRLERGKPKQPLPALPKAITIMRSAKAPAAVPLAVSL